LLKVHDETVVVHGARILDLADPQLHQFLTELAAAMDGRRGRIGERAA
jgi:hypothetical protein